MDENKKKESEKNSQNSQKRQVKLALADQLEHRIAPQHTGSSGA